MVLFILTIVIGMASAITRALMASQRLSTTTTRMAAIDTAIVQFVMQQKRLPCPADMTLGHHATQTTARKAPRACGHPDVRAETNGVVPWLDLGLSLNDVTRWLGKGVSRTESSLF